jgi:hypothetical protein
MSVDYRRKAPGTGKFAGTVEESASPAHHESRFRAAQGLNSRFNSNCRPSVPQFDNRYRLAMLK